MSQQIFELIPKVMAKVGAIEKGRKNTQQNYAFRGIDDVFAAFQSPLAEYGVFYIPEVLDSTVTERESSAGKTLIYTNLKVAYTFYAPDGSNVRAVVVGEAMDSADKSSNKAMSAALKYALLQIFCVPTESDDADAHSPEVKPKVRTAAASVSRTSQPEGDASPTVFWQLAKGNGIPQVQAQAIATECNGNWQEAVNRVKAVIQEFKEAV